MPVSLYPTCTWVHVSSVLPASKDCRQYDMAQYMYCQKLEEVDCNYRCALNDMVEADSCDTYGFTQDHEQFAAFVQ